MKPEKNYDPYSIDKSHNVGSPVRAGDKKLLVSYRINNARLDNSGAINY